MLRSLTSRSVVRPAVAGATLLLMLAACAPSDDNTATDPNASDNLTAADCTPNKLATLVQDTLTIGTDSPAYDPWFSGNDPTNGKGFESAVAYAVAEELGFSAEQVAWTKVRFNNSYRPGDKTFDFDINQISITPERAKAVDFSDGYYSAAQAVLALKGSDAASATTLEDLKGLKIGAQTGTTSLTAVRDIIQPDTDPAVFQDTAAATQALMNGQVDAIVADLPTAFYINAVELTGGLIVGQFQPTSGAQEEFGMLFEKGSPLVGCVNFALAQLRDSGELATIETEWLSDQVGVPELS